jgi:hypothetical protein
MEGRFTIFQIIFISALIIVWSKFSCGQAHKPDSIRLRSDQTEKYDNFYDSLKSKANHKKFTKLLHSVIFPSLNNELKQVDTLRNIQKFDGKTIGQIKIIRLDVFGPTINEPSQKAKLWYEKAGNILHTRSDLHNIRKNLLFKKGDMLRSSDIFENERLLRALPYIRDVRFYVETDSLEKEKVNITLLTQDRFSIGITGDVFGWESAALEIYNRNIFGIGHELSARFVGHLTKEPYMGIETFYRINNVDGRFITLSTGYTNTYLNEGAMLVLNKDFLRVSSTWGYGIAGYFFDRAHELPGEMHLKNSPVFGYHQWSGWAGRNFQIGNNKAISQLTFSGQYIHRNFSDRPNPLPNGEQFYQNSDLYLAGFTWSKRTFITDELIYAYGITEDIPKGFKNEWVIGYDDNEFGKRYYSHINISNANLLPGNSKSYLYMSAGYSSFFKSGKTEQGLAEFSSSFISRLFSSGNARFREFVSVNYRLGINRFEKEKLLFEKNNLIRGFESEEVIGKQRLSINAESVYFQRHDFYRFNIAFFIFADMGIMQSEHSSIFRGKYYSGLGIGLRLHNESLVLKTLQIRLSFYPNHPQDVGLVGFLLNEQTPQRFYSFQPGPPAPRRFE